MHKRSFCSALVAAALLTPTLSALSFAEQPAGGERRRGGHDHSHRRLDGQRRRQCAGVIWRYANRLAALARAGMADGIGRRSVSVDASDMNPFVQDVAAQSSAVIETPTRNADGGSRRCSDYDLPLSVISSAANAAVR